MRLSFPALLSATAFCFATLFNPSSSHAVGCSFTILNSDPNYNLVNLSCHKTQQDALTACESYALGTCQQLTVPEGSAIAQQGAPVGSTCYQSYGNGHPQPYALFFYGDEGNMDTDGDGIPDDEDPCPDNPDPECSNPDDPPPDDPPPPDVPDVIAIGDCEIDITELKKWLLTSESFPFNILYKVYNLVAPLKSVEPEAPVLEFKIPLDPSNVFSSVPDYLDVRVDFAPFDSIAYVVRASGALLIAWGLAMYGLRRIRSFSGVGGS